MNLIRLLLVATLMIGLVACGGGGSSSDSSSDVVDGGDTGGDSGAGSDSGSGGDASETDLSGTYLGMQSLVLSLGGVSDVAEIEAIVTVSGNNILIDPLTANGSIANNTFVATTNRTSTQAGLTCQFLLTYQGSITFESLNGNISGTAICDQGAGNETLDVSGTISANRS